MKNVVLSFQQRSERLIRVPFYICPHWAITTGTKQKTKPYNHTKFREKLLCTDCTLHFGRLLGPVGTFSIFLITNMPSRTYNRTDGNWIRIQKHWSSKNWLCRRRRVFHRGIRIYCRLRRIDNHLYSDRHLPKMKTYSSCLRFRIEKHVPMIGDQEHRVSE